MEKEKNKKEESKKKAYVKPETKKHESMNIVQGSSLYSSSGLYSGYQIVLYYTY